MHRRNVVAGLVLALGAGLLPTASIAAEDRPKEITAQDLAKTPPSATFEFDGKQLRLLVGGQSGRGVLKYQGRDYPFTGKGLSVGGIGYTESHATGTVHYLKRVEDFAGIYSAVSAGAAAGSAGKGAATFQNKNGVVLSVKAQQTGLALNLGVGGFEIAFVK